MLRALESSIYFRRCHRILLSKYATLLSVLQLELLSNLHGSCEALLCVVCLTQLSAVFFLAFAEAVACPLVTSERYLQDFTEHRLTDLVFFSYISDQVFSLLGF